MNVFWTLVIFFELLGGQLLVRYWLGDTTPITGILSAVYELTAGALFVFAEFISRKQDETGETQFLSGIPFIAACTLMLINFFSLHPTTPSPFVYGFIWILWVVQMTYQSYALVLVFMKEFIKHRDSQRPAVTPDDRNLTADERASVIQLGPGSPFYDHVQKSDEFDDI